MSEQHNSGESNEEFTSGQSFNDFYEGLKSQYATEEEPFQPEPISLDELSETDFGPLFKRIGMASPSVRANFYTAFLEGIGYRDMSNIGKGMSRLSQIPWFKPQTTLTTEEIEEHTRLAHKNFLFDPDEELEPRLIITTEFNKAIKIVEMFDERDANSYGYSYPYLDSVLNSLNSLHIKQSEKYKGDKPKSDLSFTSPQRFVSEAIMQVAYDEAYKITETTNFTIEGTGDELRKKLNELPNVLIPHLGIVIDGFLAALDAGINPNPFEPLIKLYELGVVPLGATDDDFYVFIPNITKSDVVPLISTPDDHLLD